MTDLDRYYQEVLHQAIGPGCQLRGARPVGGGCINHGVLLETSQGKLFLKWNQELSEQVFEIEARGLHLLRNRGVIAVPEPYHHGTVDGRAYLLLEYVEGGGRGINYWTDFGERLAALHRVSHPQFGLDHHNYIGSLPQYNHPDSSWVAFFINARIRPQLEIGLGGGSFDGPLMDQFERLFSLLPDLLTEEKPGLLHGDLWSGNVMTGPDGLVCLIDPAVYFGHREMELAYTRLFGGFDRSFYDSYQSNNPLAPGFEQRVDIYNLYPLLVHANLFGAGYLAQVRQIVARFV